MPEMILNRDYTHASIMGHVISFEKGRPVSVPQVCVKEIVAIGGVMASGEDADVLPPPADAPVSYDADERRQKLRDAFAIMETRGVRGDFTATGLPHLKALDELTGFTVEANERTAEWKTFTEEK